MGLAAAHTLSAAPYIPGNDNEVVEQLPTRATDPQTRAIRAARARLAREPGNAALASALARTMIERARRTGDPRDLGQAQAALAPWWTDPSPPPDVLLMRATLRQSTHDFEGAMNDLHGLIERRPTDAQAWLTQATIQQVRGDYVSAAASCEALGRLTQDLVVAVCALETRSLAGRAREAYAELNDRLVRAAASAAPPGWIQIVLAEMADRAGMHGQAESHYRAALDSEPDDAYAKGAWADFLLDANRPSEVVALLRDDTRNDALLLRRAIAERALHLPQAQASTTLLRERFDAAHLRGDVVHRREEARFALAIEGDAKRALDLARANFGVQREYWDQRVLLEAARAAASETDAEPVLAFQRQSGFHDARLAPWIDARFDHQARQ